VRCGWSVTGMASGSAPRTAPVYAAASPMPDLLDRIRNELDGRIRELRPVVREFERLERAAEAIARAGARSVPGLRSRVGPRRVDRGAVAGARGKRAPGPAAKPARRKASPAGKGTTARRKAAPRGRTQAKVLAALDAAPGSGPAAVATASGVSPAVAGATLSRLAKQGRVRRLDGGGYAVVDADTAGGPPEQTAAVKASQASPPPESG
jgi:hypothetical protein